MNSWRRDPKTRLPKMAPLPAGRESSGGVSTKIEVPENWEDREIFLTLMVQNQVYMFTLTARSRL